MRATAGNVSSVVSEDARPVYGVWKSVWTTRGICMSFPHAQMGKLGIPFFHRHKSG